MYKFNQDIAGSNNGYTVVEYKEGQIIEQEELCQELTDAWLEKGIIEVVKDDNKKEEPTNEENLEVGQELDNAGQEENAETETAENTEETENKELDNAGQEEGVLSDEELVEQAKKLLEEQNVDTDKLKEIGIRLNIKNMEKTVNGDTIISKIKKYIEETNK